MAQYTKHLAVFIEDARAAGYTVVQSDAAPDVLILGRGEGTNFVGRAQISTVEWGGKARFYKGQPIGGAQTLDDFWTMKSMRERFSIPERK